MSKDNASKKIDVSQIKIESEEEDSQPEVKVEPADTDEQEPVDNNKTVKNTTPTDACEQKPVDNNNTVNNTTPTLTALLNQPPSVAAPDRTSNGKENYMKLLNLKLAEIAPVPLDVVKVNVDLDGDLSFELSIDEGSNGEKGPEDKRAQESDVGRAEKLREADKNQDGGAKRKLTSPVRGSQGDKTLEIQEVAPDRLSALDRSELDISFHVKEKSISKSKLNNGKDEEETKDDSDKKYTCLRCGFVTAVDDDLRNHMLKWHESDLGSDVHRLIRKKIGIKYHPCDKCDQNFPTPRLLQYHRAIHTKVKVFTCGKCDQSFATFKVLQKHQFEDQGGCLNAYRFSSNTGEPEQKSDKDKKSGERTFHPTFSDENLKTVNEKGENTYICQYFLSCRFKTAEHEQLDEHMKSTHKGSGKPFSCTMCDYKDYQYGNLVSHRIQHLGATSKVVCKTVWIPPEATPEQLIVETDDQSRSSDSSSVEPPPTPVRTEKSKPDDTNPPQGSDTESSLEPPPAKMKKSLPGLLTCEYCEYVAAKPYQLQNHLRVHTGEKPYSCMRCDNLSFKGSDGLRRHMKKHRDEDEHLMRLKKKAAYTGTGDIEETDPLAGPPVPLPPECQALLDAEKKAESGKVNSVHLAHGAVSSSEEKALDSGMSFPCEDCQTVFPSYQSLKNHEINKHGGLTLKPPLETMKCILQLACKYKKCKYKTKEDVLLQRHYLKKHASSAIPKKSLQKAASLVRMVSSGSKVKVACDSTTLDDELKTLVS